MRRAQAKRPLQKIVLAALAAVLTVSVVGCDTGRDSDDASAAPSSGTYRITWGACDPDRREQGNLVDGVECGTMTLPVDWAHPDGDTFTTRVYRQRAEGTARGTILNFPSGPGETADQGFTTYQEFAPDFDYIGIDPRGVASTAPVTCDLKRITAAPLVPPLTAKAFAAGRNDREALARSCRTTPRSLIDHLDAYSYAKDAEALRTAIGAKQITVTGFSYGTLQAARYLELFGDNVNGAILDGVMAPGEPVDEFQSVTAGATQQVFDEFAKWCTTATKCRLPKRDASAAIAAAKRHADAGRIPGTTMMGKQWDAAGVVESVVAAIADGDFETGADVLAKLAAGKNPDPSGGPDMTSESSTALPFPDRIVCADFNLGIRDSATAKRVFERAAEGNPDTPFSTNAAQYTVICSGAPEPDAAASRGFRARGSFPILLLANRIDVATPKAWAEKVAASLGSRAQLAEGSGIGHGGALADPAVKRAVRDYLKNVG